jgi:hypothetical protein
MGPTCRAGGGSRHRLEQIAPNAVTCVEDVDFGVIDQSDPGDETAAGLLLPPGLRHLLEHSNEVLDLNTDAIAFAALTYAMDTSSVDGA